MLICQISDLHVGADGDDADERNSVRLRAVIDHVRALDPAPDLIIISGDLTERGDRRSYERLRDMLTSLGTAPLLMVGNHDRRTALLEVFPDTPVADGFVQYVRDWPALRLIVLDTLEEGRAGGSFCATRAAWLTAQLAERSATPTLIALHHPPFPVGIDWMDPPADAAWIERLREHVVANPQIVGMIAGHIHRPVVGAWAGTSCVVASSVAPQLALELRPTPAEEPDGRALVILTPPSFSLHRCDASFMVSHFVRVEPTPAIVRLDERMVPVLAEYLREAPAG